jgi:asparagine synthase (glutamine-hydrolysing)
MMIDLNNEYSYNLITNNAEIYFRGNLILNEKHIRTAGDLVDLLRLESNCIDYLKSNVKEFNGHFSIIVVSESKITLFSDVGRTYPVFYRRISEDQFSISDNVNALLEVDDLFDPIQVDDFLSCGYCLKDKTLFRGIFQIESSQIIELSSSTGVLKEFYFTYENADLFNENRVYLENMYAQIIEQITRDLKLRTNTSQVVVPLSGGYDSRFLLTLLLDAGIKNIVCYTYGSKSSYEVYTAKKICQRLNIKLHFIDYDRKFISDSLDRNEFINYEYFAGNYCSLPHVQDFLAVKFLKESNLISDNAIFMPGIAGDVYAGSQIPNGYSVVSKYDEYDLKNQFLNFPGHPYKSDLEFKKMNHTSIEQFTVSEKVPKFVVNSVRIYEYFNYEFYLPLWNLQLLDYFSRLPAKYKNVNQNPFKLYNNIYLSYAFRSFENYDIAFKKTDTIIYILRGLSYLKRKLKIAQDSVNNFDIIIDILERMNDCNSEFFTHRNVNLALSKIYIKLLNERC